MTTKEKAEDLVDKFKQTDLFVMTTRYNLQTPKQCALIAVDEILSICTQTHFIDYWQKVKQEIEKL